MAGHSMGGYGTIRLGMKYPDVWSVIYILSACCMEEPERINPDVYRGIEAITEIEQLEYATFHEKAKLASAAAWAPNPNKPPFYLDLPFENGEVRPEIAAKIKANRTLYLIEQYVPNLKKLSAIAMDAGLQDERISSSTAKLHELLDAYHIPHMYESYEGDHTNRVGEPIGTKTLPFFSEHLTF